MLIKFNLCKSRLLDISCPSRLLYFNHNNKHLSKGEKTMSNHENNKQEITMSLDEFDSTITEAEKLIFEMEGIRTSHYNIDSPGQSPVVIDKNLDIVMIPEMPVDEIYYKSGGLYQVTITDRQGYADESGKVVIPCKYETAYPSPVSKL